MQQRTVSGSKPKLLVTQQPALVYVPEKRGELKLLEDVPTISGSLKRLWEEGSLGYFSNFSLGTMRLSSFRASGSALIDVLGPCRNTSRARCLANLYFTDSL